MHIIFDLSCRNLQGQPSLDSSRKNLYFSNIKKINKKEKKTPFFGTRAQVYPSVAQFYGKPDLIQIPMHIIFNVSSRNLQRQPSLDSSDQNLYFSNI